MGREADELRDVIRAGPFTFPALDKVEPVFEEALKLLGELASDPGFTGEAADAASAYAEALRSDYLKALLEVEKGRGALQQANSAWLTALRKYAEFDDPDESIIDNGREAVAAVLTGGLSVLADALDVFGDDDDDRGEDGIAQLRRDLEPIPKYEFDPNLATGRVPYSGPSGPDLTVDDIPTVEPITVPPVNPNDYPRLTPIEFAGVGSGLAIDGPGGGIAGGGGGGGGGGGVGGMHGVGGAGAGGGLGGVGMLGAGAGAGVTAAGAAAAAKLGGKGMMGGGGGMGGGAGAEKKEKRPSSGLKAPELEEDDEKAPRSEGAGAGGRASLPDES